jgi:hypothetical protein
MLTMLQTRLSALPRRFPNQYTLIIRGAVPTYASWYRYDILFMLSPSALYIIYNIFS